MQIDVLLEPAGEEADLVLRQWIRERGLPESDEGRVGIRPEQCLEALADLRSRCFDRGLMVNATFAGDRE
jgi:hypothetical protein